MKAKASKRPAAWDRVHVIEGEPFLARLALDMVTEEAGGGQRVRLGKGDPRLLRDSLQEFAMYEKPLIYVLSEPNAEVCLRLLEIVEGGCITAAAVVVMAGENGLDGRTVFSKAAKRHKRILHLEPILADNARGLSEYLKDWQKESGVTLDPDSLIYLRTHCPVRTIKGTRGSDGATIDLETLESELTKVAIVAKAEGRCTEGLARFLCDFDPAPTDVWSFARAASQGDSQKALALLDIMDITKDNLGPLWLLLSQLEFMIGVASVSTTSLSPEATARALEDNPYAGRFSLSDGNMPAKPARTKLVNSWRVKKTLEDSGGVLDADRLARYYQAVVNALRDIRADLPPRLVTLYLCLALGGRCRYESPLSDLRRRVV